MQNVRKVVSEADGYQPHLIAPEQGYRRLIDGALNYFKGPAEASVDAVTNFYFLMHFFLLAYPDFCCGHKFYLEIHIGSPPSVPNCWYDGTNSGWVIPPVYLFFYFGSTTFHSSEAQGISCLLDSVYI